MFTKNSVMKRLLYILFLCQSLYLSAQDTVKGIRFEMVLGWSQVLTKAKAENKMIFVDCYTTWCLPCKKMEKNIYPLEEVGNFFNEHFICVKVQMDKTKADNDQVKKWYDDASRIEKLYSITEFPTFLFLSPDGKPLHRAAGGFGTNQFLSIASNALNPETQSYTLAAKYDPDKMDTAEMKGIALSIKRSSPELAGKIALKYLGSLNMKDISKKENIELLMAFASNVSIQQFTASYLNTLTLSQLLTEQIIDLMPRFLNSSSDFAFKFFYRNYEKVDEVKNAKMEYKTWFSKSFVGSIIYNEEVNPALENSKKDGRMPNWQKIKETILKKYNQEYADRLTILGKMKWYAMNKKMEEFTKYTVQYMDAFGKSYEFDWGYNHYAWTVFKYSNDPQKLERALSWSNRAISMNPTANHMDTYANILYKIGKKSLAVRWEEIAAQLDATDGDIQANLNKMKLGEPTWPVN